MKTRFLAFPGNENVSSATRVQSPMEGGARNSKAEKLLKKMMHVAASTPLNCSRKLLVTVLIFSAILPRHVKNKSKLFFVLQHFFKHLTPFSPV